MTSRRRLRPLTKFLVNAPKGGVGKTTLSLALATRLSFDHRVLALDLAQGCEMSTCLARLPAFADQRRHRIVVMEAEAFPPSLPGEASFDFLVADSDDAYTHLTRFIQPGYENLRLVVPIAVGDEMALRRLTDLAELAAAAVFAGVDLKLWVVPNKCGSSRQAANLRKTLVSLGIGARITHAVLPLVGRSLQRAPEHFYQDERFASALDELIAEIS